MWQFCQGSTYIYRCSEVPASSPASSQPPGGLGTPTNWWPHVSCHRFTWRHPEVSLSRSLGSNLHPTEWFPRYQAPESDDWLAWLAAKLKFEINWFQHLRIILAQIFRLARFVFLLSCPCCSWSCWHWRLHTWYRTMIWRVHEGARLAHWALHNNKLNCRKIAHVWVSARWFFAHLKNLVKIMFKSKLDHFHKVQAWSCEFGLLRSRPKRSASSTRPAVPCETIVLGLGSFRATMWAMDNGRSCTVDGSRSLPTSQ